MFLKFISILLLNTLVFYSALFVFKVFLHPCKNHVTSTQTHLLPAFSLTAPNKLFVHTECSVHLDTIKGYELCTSLHLRKSAAFIVTDRKWPEVSYQLPVLSLYKAQGHTLYNCVTTSMFNLCVYTSRLSVLIISY